ncbi:hypothetical protein EBR56_09210 [bacterium]|nr:hypothetical protein [bacterium]
MNRPAGLRSRRAVLKPLPPRQTSASSAGGERPAVPIWEYDHEVGKSITGGFVVRDGTVPALEERYLYGDHVTGRMWALWRDAAGHIENKSID